MEPVKSTEIGSIVPIIILGHRSVVFWSAHIEGFHHKMGSTEVHMHAHNTDQHAVGCNYALIP